MTSHPLVGADLEHARKQIRVAEDRRRRERMTGGKGGCIEVGGDEINVGGVKVKMRTET